MPIRPAFLLALLAISSPCLGEGAPRKEALPIRGAELLEAMRSTPLPPMPKQAYVSNDGSKVLYVEWVHRPPYGVGYENYLDKDPGWRIWLQDTRRGDRRLVMDDKSQGKAGLRPFLLNGLLNPRWSDDGKSFALLQREQGQLIVWEFELDNPSVRRMHRFPIADEPVEIRNWQWDPEHEEITVGIVDGVRDAVKPESKALNWSWILSRDFASNPDSREPLRVSRFLKADQNDKQLHEVRLRYAGRDISLYQEGLDYAGGRGRYVNWQMFDANSAVVSEQERSFSTEANAERAIADSEQNVASAVVNGVGARRVLGVDLASGEATELFTSGSGRIAVLANTARSQSYAFIQSTAATSNEPMLGAWGELFWKSVDDRAPVNSHVQLSEGSRLFASDKADSVYHFDPLLLKISEISRESQVVSDLGVEGLSATHCDVSRNGQFVVAVFEAANTPPQIRLWNSRERIWKTLYEPGKDWKNPGHISVEHLEWRSRDDVFDVDGLLVRPENFDPQRKYPLIVLMQGGNTLRTSRVVNRFDPMFGGGRSVGGPPAAIYADAGYLVLLPNHRGSEGAGVAANRAMLGNYGRHVELDVFTGIDALVNKGWVDPTQMAVIGHSHGGDEAYYAIAHSDRFRAAVINDSFIPMPEFYVPFFEAYGGGYREGYGRDVLTLLTGADPVLHPLGDAFKVRTPLLIRWSGRSGRVRGSEPERLGFSQGWDPRGMAQAMTYRLLYALRSNGVPMDVVLDQDEHQVENPKYMLEWQSRVLQWLDYFVRQKGENPIPAMDSPFDYQTELLELESIEK